jgi:hypothetical protein
MRDRFSKWAKPALCYLVFKGWLLASPVGSVAGVKKDASGGTVAGVKATSEGTTADAYGAARQIQFSMSLTF